MSEELRKTWTSLSTATRIETGFLPPGSGSARSSDCRRTGSEAGFLVTDAFANLDRFKTFSFGSLTLVVPSLLHMTAMKLAALRTQTDRDDVVVLLKQLRTRGMDRGAVLAHVGGLMPVAKQESARYDLEDLWEHIDEPT